MQCGINNRSEHFVPKVEPDAAPARRTDVVGVVLARNRLEGVANASRVEAALQIGDVGNQPHALLHLAQELAQLLVDLVRTVRS